MNKSISSLTNASPQDHTSSQYIVLEPSKLFNFSPELYACIQKQNQESKLIPDMVKKGKI